FHDVTALKATERRLTLLADAGSILGRSVDYQESLNELARMVVPDLADWCVVDVVEQESGVRRVAVAHEDPSLVALAEEVQRRWPSNMEEGATGEVLRTGEPLLVPIITEEQLAAAASDAEHDMRTPLAAILGYVQLALRRARKTEKSGGGEKLVEYLSAAENMAGRLTDLVADLMDVSLLRSGRPIALEPVELEIGPVAERIIDAHRRLARQHHFVLDHAQAVTVRADLRRFERVLDNLVGNA